MRFVFVHGTGVRRERHDLLFGLVAERLGRRFPTAAVDSCYWGDEHGASLAHAGASVPGFPPSGPAGHPGTTATPPDPATAEWQLLLVDPLYELRLIAALGPEQAGRGMPGVRAAGFQTADLLAALPRHPEAGSELALLLHATGLDGSYPSALDTVGASEEFRGACEATTAAAAGDLVAAAGRAVVARLLFLHAESTLCTGAERDRLVELLTSALGGTGRGVVGRAARLLGTTALRMTPQPWLDHGRSRLTAGSVPVLGDILRYQAKGGPLRDTLAAHVTASDGPTVLIGHSLGGVALVDLLALAALRGKPLGDVRLLVTVGSQAPFLHELGALTGLPTGAPLPTGFPRWLNVFDRNDLLAFRARPVFAGADQVVDHEIDSRQPFPVCHSAYWKIDDVYDRIAEETKALR
ncbi:hypothetical protein ACIRS1_13605 [Kitasatospora sp. NPDC101176]|uniref:hypothetical protein n=1 Tax=Kitasatospora sp. NPDC101176 TaxID=3364099 RepID=UPI0037F3E932